MEENEKDGSSAFGGRAVFLAGEINDTSAKATIERLFELSEQDSRSDILLVVNSEGGEVYSGLAIYDTMQIVTADVATLCVGKAMSMGSIILCGGAAGKRFITANARAMIHSPAGGSTYELMHLNSSMIEIYKRHTALSLPDLRKYMQQDKYFTAKQAVKFGLVDGIITKLKRWGL